MKENATTIRKIVPAMSTPLASIFGSGFLVIVPILASAVGPYAIPAMAVVAFVAFMIGTIIRHNILCAEAVLERGSRRVTVVFERLSGFALVAAYIVSVCLYVHILSAFALADFKLDTDLNKSLLTTAIIGIVTIIGLLGGLKPLEKLEQWALYVTVVILVALLIVFAFYDVSQYLVQPLVPVLKGNYGDNSLIVLAATASVLLPLPLIVAASLSQFSAAVALAWSGSTFEIIALASRAFAFYYLLQCAVAFSVCRNHRERLRFVFIGVILGFVLIFAVPAG